MPTSRLGLLVAGSVAEGLSARLDPTVPIEDVRLGKFVKIVGQKYEYFCLVTDVQLDSANPDVLRDPPGDPSTVDVFLRQVLSGTTTYALIKLKPELMLANTAADVDFEELFRALNRIGYQGPLSIEWEDSGMERDWGAPDALAFVRRTDFAPSEIAFDAAMQKAGG